MNFKQQFFSWYHRQAFDPSWFGGMLCNPFFQVRRALRREIGRAAASFRGTLLDVGCGTAPYRSLFAHCDYTGLEFDCPEMRKMGVADYFYQGEDFPFADGYFEGILCSQVLEHVFNPDDFLTECHRVLTPGGMMLITSPFVWAEHNQPYDFARYTSFGLRALLERNGFEIVYVNQTVDDASLFFQLFNLFIFDNIRVKNSRLRMLLILLLTAPSNWLGQLAGCCLPKNRELYLDNIALARKK